MIPWLCIVSTGFFVNINHSRLNHFPFSLHLRFLIIHISTPSPRIRIIITLQSNIQHRNTHHAPHAPHPITHRRMRVEIIFRSYAPVLSCSHVAYLRACRYITYMARISSIRRGSCHHITSNQHTVTPLSSSHPVQSKAPSQRQRKR